MKFKNEKMWNEGKAKNTDPYGSGIFDYAERWADLMESHIRSGKILDAETMKSTSHVADTDGITGFMYGAAVSILSAVWIHGEQLRRWHNKNTQIHSEGDAANDSGGVLNPAILTIGSPRW